MAHKQTAQKQAALRIGFYAGSFDPLTLGHLDIVRAASWLCDKVVVAIGVHPGKAPMFSAAERIELVRGAWTANPGAAHCALDVVTFDDLAVNAAARVGARFLVRGLRDGTDFDYEMQLAGMNGTLAPQIETVFLPAKPAFRHVSATLVRQIAQMGGDVSAFVPDNVANALKARVQAHAQQQDKK